MDLNKYPSYIGTKQLRAVPMTRKQYNDFRKWTLPEDENGADAGYLVLYADSEPNTPEYKDYASWSPKSQFEKFYRRTDGMTFGLAIDAMKLGCRVARAGWNGKGMYLRLVNPGAPHPDQLSNPEQMAPGMMNPYFKPADNNKYADGTMLPWIGMKTADNKFVPWLASQTDMLCEDWVIL